MKNTALQIGKAICYVLLFLGCQVLTSFIVQFAFGLKIGFEMSVTGEVLNEQELIARMTELLMASINWITMLSGIVTILFLLVFFKIRKQRLANEANLFRFEKVYILPLILLGAAFAMFVLCMLNFLPLPESLLESYAEASSWLNTGSILSSILSTVITAPIVEEIIFRGLVLSRLKRVMPVWVAVFLSSLAFGVVHGQLLWIAYAFVLGIVFAIVAECTKSTAASVLVHMVFNLVGMSGDYLGITETWQILLAVVVSAAVMAGTLSYIIKRKKTAA